MTTINSPRLLLRGLLVALLSVLADSDKLTPIKGVTVTISDTGQSAKTDNSGNYTIADVRVGNIKVRAKKPPYDIQWKTGITIFNGETTTLNFKLVR